MKRNHKRILISLIALLGLTGMYGAFHATNAHADLADMQLQNEDNRLNQDADRMNSQAQWDQDEANWDNMKDNEPHETYGQEIEDQERPLSEIYPNGHWNGESDIKGDNTNYEKSEEKRENKEDKALDKEIQSEDAADNKAERRSNRWYANHSYINRSTVRYVRYKNFSKRYYRPAFISDLASYPKVGLTKSWKAVKKSAYVPIGKKTITYKSDATIKPNQPFWAKVIRYPNKESCIYRIKFRGHYYYYANECDKYTSDISPITADYSYSKKYHSASYTSFYKPWLHQIIVLNKRHKLNKHIEWDYNYDNKGGYGAYKLYKNKWHNTGTGLDVPSWL